MLWTLVGGLVVSRGESCRVIAIVSAQRSGSSELATKVSSLSEGRVENWNEALDWWAVKQGYNFSHYVSDDDLEHTCDRPLETVMTAVENRCSFEPCGAVLKLFDQHCHKWENTTNLDDILGSKDVCVVVLERNPGDRKCSLDWAKEMGDWGIRPGNHLPIERPPCPPEDPRDPFIMSHHRWFNRVRDILHAANMPFLDIPSESYIHDKFTEAEVATLILNYAGFPASIA